MSDERFHWDTRPIALKENVICGESCRFTVLTPRLIRMEYSKQNLFENRPSQSVFYRDFPTVSYEVLRDNGQLIIDTGDLHVIYKEGKSFSPETLQVSLKKEPASTWKFGEDFEDLGGTVKTLDWVDGEIPLGRGICSRYGFSVMDDSNTMLLGDEDWVEIRTQDTKDIYFFGYGYDYLEAVQDFYRLTGVPPMLPDYALGNWWSRYYPYSQQEYIDLIERFREEDVPFSVSVVDMEWHLRHVSDEYIDPNDRLENDTWTGYTWNKELFPNYKEFLKYLREHNLKTALNLHPHAGVRRFDDMYEKMALACGIDPASGKRVPFDILSPEFMAHYFDILHHPYEEDGVDFWWMDWQQGKDYHWIHEPNSEGKLHDEREILDPLWMLNHLHILDIMRNGKRPMFFSRYSGPGSQRYPVGFSGDTIVTWESLKFQPYFTATASNIGYGWWSHDIGGHMHGYRDDELTVRWIQLGVFSPINRLHSGRDVFIQREPWSYPREIEEIMKEWLRLRHRMFPYIYTMAFKNHVDLVPLIQPMYYSYPKYSAAYEVPEQFWFGSELIVAPITEKNSTASHMGKTIAWIPEGNWFDFFDGTHYVSSRGRKMQLHRELYTYPVLAKAGAIVPMAQHTKHDNRLGKAEKMEVVVFPGANNNFILYEDEGDSFDYQKGAFVNTEMNLTWGNVSSFTICPAKGDLLLIPKVRTWTILLRGFHTKVKVKVLVDGKTYSTEKKGQQIQVTAAVTSEIQVFIEGEQLINDNAHVEKKCLKILQHAQMDVKVKKQILDVVNDKSLSLREKSIKMAGSPPEQRAVIEAIKEQLSLTEEPCFEL